MVGGNIPIRVKLLLSERANKLRAFALRINELKFGMVPCILHSYGNHLFNLGKRDFYEIKTT